MTGDMIPSKEGLRRDRSKLRWAFANRYKILVEALSNIGQDMSHGQMYALDLCAEHLALPISQMQEVVSDHLDQLVAFFDSGKCSEVEYALMQAEDCYPEQFLAQPEEEQNSWRNEHRLWLRRRLERMREELGVPRDQRLDLVDIAIWIFNAENGLGWDSRTTKDQFGHEVHAVGRKEAREELEKARTRSIKPLVR